MKKCEDRKYTLMQSFFLVVISLAPVVIAVFFFLKGVHWNAFDLTGKVTVVTVAVIYYAVIQTIVLSFDDIHLRVFSRICLMNALIASLMLKMLSLPFDTGNFLIFFIPETFFSMIGIFVGAKWKHPYWGGIAGILISFVFLGGVFYLLARFSY